MAKELHHWTLSELAMILQGEMSGADVTIARPVTVGSNDPQGITFATNEKYMLEVLGTDVGAVIVPRQTPEIPKPCIRVDDPRKAYGMVLGLSVRPLPLASGIHPTAVVSPEAIVDQTAHIGAYVVIEAGAEIEPGAQVYPFCYVGDSCKVGPGSILYPHVVLYQDVVLGRGCVVHSGVVLGADGFRFMWDGTKQVKIPQVGGVVLGDFVEVGANSCIDRAMAGDTEIGKGTKLDNLIQIGHNVKVGEHTVMASQVGVAGSTEIGDRVTVGGQAAFSHHVKVADDVVLGGRTGVTSDISEAGEYFGLPPVPVGQALRAAALGQKLPEIVSRLRALEKRVRELEND